MEQNIWTREQLHQLIGTRLAGCKFIVVSNREPYIHQHRKDGTIECIRPASGMATALHPILVASGGTWIAQGAGTADREVVDENDRVPVPPKDPSYLLRRVWLTKEQEQGFYYGLSNEGLWPLCHLTFTRPVFRLKDWKAYREVNEIFARAVIEEAGDETTIVFIQDYHFCLLPRMLKKMGRGNLIVAMFWHIPWPNREMFRAFPWAEELLDGMLGNDLLGFHIRHHCQNFRDTVDRSLEARVDPEQSSVTRGGYKTLVQRFPISIDFSAHEKLAASPEVEAEMEKWRSRLPLDGRLLGVGIERLDYTKGIPARLEALDYFFEEHPEWRGKVVFCQVAVPSRSDLESYQNEAKTIDRLTNQMNARWGTDDWKPIILIKEHQGPEQMMALHRLCHFFMVNSLNDGMNLVAKEFVASRLDEAGVLLLSRFTGAARELPEAVGFNPFAVHQIANAIAQAVAMDPEEQGRRMRRMREHVREFNVYRWAGQILSTLLRFDIPELDYQPNDATVLD